MRRTILLLLALLAMANDSRSSVPADCGAILNTARSALDEHRFALAAQAFDQFAIDCPNAPRRPTDHPFSFYTALARQLEATILPTESARRSTLLAEAAALYEQMLVDAPTDRAALNNLAIIYSELGDRDRAQKRFQSALAEGGASEPWYLATYARFLVQGQQYDEAAKYLAQAFALSPSHLEAVIGDFELRFQRDGATAALTHLALLSAKKPEQAWRVVANSLPNSKWDSMSKQLALAIATSAMASELKRMPAVKEAISESLQLMQNDEDIGTAAQELGFLLTDRSISMTDFPWWSKQTTPTSGTDKNLGQAFYSFALAAGATDLRAGNYPRASEKYFLVATLEYPQISTEPILQLAELYTSVGDSAAFSKLVARYDDHMTRNLASTDASTLRQSYDYHRQLLAFGNAFQDGACSNKLPSTQTSPSRVDIFIPSAACSEMATIVEQEFQRATEAARAHNAASRFGAALTLDPDAFATAARSYTILGNREQAAKTRVKAVQSYMAAEKFGSALREIKSIERDELFAYISPDDLAALNSLRSAKDVTPAIPP